jgi:hypothetical protein
MNRRGVYTSDTHQVTTAALRSEQMCNYDLDDLDIRWLNIVNGERALMGKSLFVEKLLKSSDSLSQPLSFHSFRILTLH